MIDPARPRRPAAVRLIWRRVRAGQTIRLPGGGARRSRTVPNAPSHARRFVLGFAAVVILGGGLLATPWTAADGRATPPVDALFTAVSAAYSTGLVTVDTADHWNRRGEVVILLLMQIGGLGFMVGAGIVLQMLRRQVSLGDALLLRDGDPALSIREAADLSGRILCFTLATEAAGAVALAVWFWGSGEAPPGRALWHGVFLSVSAFCNASFDLSGGFASLQPYRTVVWVNVVIALLVQAGALSYVTLRDAATTRRWTRFALETKLVLLAHGVLVLVGTAAFLALEWGRSLAGTPGWAKPMASAFHAVTARSGGFATVDLGAAGGATLFVFSAVMLIGGASGSTAGGVRLGTVAVVVAAIGATLRGEAEPQVFGRRIPTPLVFRAMAVIALFVLAHAAATLLLALTEGAGRADAPSFLALFFEAASALATDGLSTGITPRLSTAGKLVLCGTMFLGRVGPLTAVYALQRRQQRRARYRLPEGAVRIG